MARAAADVAVFLNVRMQSRRCPGKMLRPFADTTLLDICLAKLRQLAWPRTYVGAWEPELLARARRYPELIVYERSAASARSDSDGRRIFEILTVIDTPWVMWVNPCVPLLSVETLQKALAAFLADDCRSLTSVRALHGWFYAAEGRPLNDTQGSVDTMQSQPIYAAAHAFHIYERERMLAEGSPFPNRPGDPRLFTIPEGEAHDIDTEDEFDVVEILYRRRTHG